MSGPPAYNEADLIRMDHEVDRAKEQIRYAIKMSRPRGGALGVQEVEFVLSRILDLLAAYRREVLNK